ncbi:hypothetical protein BC567DRAFT_17129 [Phyllosticta citribraziliensis]
MRINARPRRRRTEGMLGSPRARAVRRDAAAAAASASVAAVVVFGRTDGRAARTISLSHQPKEPASAPATIICAAMAIFLRGRRLPSSSSSSCCFAPADAIRVSDRFCPSRRDGHGSLPLDCLVCWRSTVDTHPVGLTTPLTAVGEQTGDGTEILSLPDTLKDGPFRANCPVMPSLVCPGNGTYGSNLIVSHHQGSSFPCCGCASFLTSLPLSSLSGCPPALSAGPRNSRRTFVASRP